MKYVERLARVACLVALLATLSACPRGIQRFTIRIVNNSSDLYVTRVFLGKLQGANLTVVSDNLLNDDVDPANDDEISVRLALADDPNANSIGYLLEDLNGFVIDNNAVLSEGFADGVIYTLTVTGSAAGPFDVEFEREDAVKSDEEL